MNTDQFPGVPFMSGITRESDYRIMLESQKGADFSASEEEGIKISEIVRKLVRLGGGASLHYNQQIFWDAEDLDSVAEEELIRCALEGREINGSVPDELWNAQVIGHGDGHEYEIIVEIFAGG